MRGFLVLHEVRQEQKFHKNTPPFRKAYVTKLESEAESVSLTTTATITISLQLATAQPLT